MLAPMTPFKILFFGDIIGAIGRQAVIKALPDLREQYEPDVVIANVENLAHGRGITAKTLLELDAAGIDAYTSGNHVFENGAGLSCFADPRWKDRLVRPSNIMGRPGRGIITLDVQTDEDKKPVRLVVTNLLGQLMMKDEVSNPFTALTEILTHTTDADLILVDFHAEATSEKEAFGHFADGKVTGVFGTHTHVPTADQKILPGGTAYTTDVGRNGASDSVIGFTKADAVHAFTVGQIAYGIPENGKAEINAVLLTANLDTHRAVTLDRIRIFVDI